MSFRNLWDLPTDHENRRDRKARNFLHRDKRVCSVEKEQRYGDAGRPCKETASYVHLLDSNYLSVETSGEFMCLW